ncbi:hypothetical protein CS063_07965 [Sporanaerobium hydrogeniformans]|uniref:Uncharacterized protein n=1 Tax=Sporanaerobium hydrogeniformans TaxID=3072179 RepID=A0AC61DDZ1_9FIRM|nr:hypothetical protein [Sporanaerobium hydrogeniformans]PHV70946.1 hypothetical protein CS063_07965 [Sporanaerobium hydrogeniformans]
MSYKKNTLLYIGLICILIGAVALLQLNGMLPTAYLSEIVNVVLAFVFLIIYIKRRDLILLLLGIFFAANGGMLIVGRMIGASTYLARFFFIPGSMLLGAYLAKKKSVLSIMGSLFTLWGLYFFFRDPMYIRGFSLSIGALFLFTALAFLLILILERQSWPLIPALVFGGSGVYSIAMTLSPLVKNMALQGMCIILIIVGVVFVIRSLFKQHLEDQDE